MGWEYHDGIGWLEDAAIEFTHDDGTAYRRIPTDAFPVFDEIDSTTVVDDEPAGEEYEHPGWMGISDGEAPRAD